MGGPGIVENQMQALTRFSSLEADKIASMSWSEYIETFNFNDHQPAFYRFDSVVYTIAFYLMSIHVGKFLMRNQKPIDLGAIPRFHNLFLCILSIFMFFGVSYEIIKSYLKTDFWTLACDPDGVLRAGPVYFWYYIFYMSKIYEFIDTWIQLAKKREPPFLHMWHHSTTFLLCWVMYQLETSIQWMSIILNCFVHIFMYWYYYLSSGGRHVSWKKYMTLLQIIQFVVTNSVSYFWLYTYYYGEKPCRGTEFGFWFGQFILGSFLFLFIRFFLQDNKSRLKQDQNNNKKSQ